jgi:hypothetical protein
MSGSAFSLQAAWLVISGRDRETGAVSVRLHHDSPQSAKPKGEVLADILAASKLRRA